MANDDEVQIDPESEDNSPGASIFDAYQPEDVHITMGVDGFPMEHDPPGASSIPSLTPENLVCMDQPDGTHKCTFYIRQLIPSKDLEGRKFMRRMCTHPAFKTLSGAGYDLTDSAVYACEARNPAHFESEKEIDVRDARTAARALDKKEWRMFRTAEEAAAGIHTLGANEHERREE